MSHTFAPFTVIHGAISPESAFVVDDYPYGFRLRCKIRYWLEYKKGHGKRLMSQTTNPKITGREVWNKPKGSTYSNGLAVMYLDHEGHVQWDCLHIYTGAENVERFFTRFYQQLGGDDRRVFSALLIISRKSDTQGWEKFAAAHAGHALLSMETAPATAAPDAQSDARINRFGEGTAPSAPIA